MAFYLLLYAGETIRLKELIEEAVSRAREELINREKMITARTDSSGSGAANGVDGTVVIRSEAGQ